MAELPKIVKLKGIAANPMYAKETAAEMGGRLATGTVGNAATAGSLVDFFQYTIDYPVSLARQKCAMLPIVGKDIEGQKVSIYNQHVQAKHPLLGLKFKNTSGAHLNQEPRQPAPTSEVKMNSRIICVLVVSVVCSSAGYLVAHAVPSQAQNAADVRLIAGQDTVFIEEMTWMEVRDALKDKMTTVLIPTGGVEENGPYVITGKHNYIMRATAEAIARKLGDTLVAPIVPFVPEGAIDPPTGHMKYPGTISLREGTYERLLTDICSCLRIAMLIPTEEMLLRLGTGIILGA